MNEPYLLRSIRKDKKRKQTKREEQEKEGRKGKPKDDSNMPSLTVGSDALFSIDMSVILVNPPPLVRGVG